MSLSQNESSNGKRRFFGYPKAVEAPITPYKKSEDANPVLSGIVLVIIGWIVSKLEFVQRILWANAGFSSLRRLDGLKFYKERWDPTVIPINVGSDYVPDLNVDSFSSLPADSKGRYHTILEYHSLFISGELTPLALIDTLLPLIRRDIDQPSKHSIAFVDCNHKSVLEAAKASTSRYQTGKHLGILDGIPIAVKADTSVKGYRNTHGRKPNDNIFSPETESSWPIQKWVEAGGIVLGKLNMHEIGADTTNNNPNLGTPRNPHNDEYYPGGSSGGAAYAVSSGLIPVALGTDGGGSIRIPASFCGLYGLKTSHNRLEDRGSTVTGLGPLAANLSDLEATYRLMAIPNPFDQNCSLFAPPGVISNDRPKIIGIYKDWFDRAEPSVLAICNEAIDYFRDTLGYLVIPIKLPHVPEGQIAHAFTILTEMANRARQTPSSRSWLSGLNPANKILLAAGDQTPARDYLLAQQLRQMLMQHLAFLYEKHPGLVIVTPTTPMAGWPIGNEVDLKHGVTDGNKTIRNGEFVWLANFCGNPAISCPVGYVEPAKGNGKIPIGLMAMGEWGSEDELLAWGRDAEKWLNGEYPGGRQRPANWVDVVDLSKS